MADTPLVEQLDELDGELRSLQDGVALNTHRQALAELDEGINGLAGAMGDLRRRGYRFKSYLESKALAMEGKWKIARVSLYREIESAEQELRPVYEELVRKVSDLRGAVARNSPSLRGEISTLDSRMEHLRARVDTVEASIQAIYSGIRQTFFQTCKQIEEAEWLLDQIEQASFALLVGENAIQAVKAKWWRDGKKKGPEGILYLTDQRLLFEQKEERATKKVLFIATEKETLQELLLEVPVSGIDAIKPSSKGLFGNEDHLDFSFGASASYATAHFHIDGQKSEDWVGLANRIQSGDIHRERFYAEDEMPGAQEAALEAMLASAPERCSSCGAGFDAPIIKGQRQIRCEYCGTTMRW